MTYSLFDQSETAASVWRETPRADVCLLHGQVLAQAELIWAALQSVLQQSALRHMQTPGGRRMQVENTSCGQLGWISDAAGYRYSRHDPLTGRPWPAMPSVLFDCARNAATAAGFPDFVPDSCLINRYTEKIALSLHQDKDEQDLTQPIVSVSLGMPAVFLLGGMQRSAPCQKLLLEHGDVLVWGGSARLCFHGVQALPLNPHPQLGAQRINLTFRRAGRQ